MPDDSGIAPITTVTLCGYPAASRVWAFNQMGSARRALGQVEGLRFWKLLGTGHGRGFSLRPDFSRYGLLAVWEHRAAANAFFERSTLVAGYRSHAREVWTAYLETSSAHGAWSGVNPFLPAGAHNGSGPVAVLTRASIRWSRLRAFWRAVPQTTVALDRAGGLLASIGTGETPVVRPATFSLWRSTADLEAYAYQAQEHVAVIRRRQDEGWYTEELFARFRPIESTGTWNGTDPLQGLL